MKNITIIALGLMLALTNNHAKAQWVEINSTPTKIIDKFNFITDDIGYALMSNKSEIHRTTNGGNAWTAITTPPAITTFFDFSFPKDSVGFVVHRDMSNATTPSMIYRTMNNGTTWQNITPASTNAGSGNAFVQFIDENVGFWAVGTILYRTIDGGTNWDTTSISSNMNYFQIQSMDFYDANNGVIGIHDGTFMYLGSMFATTDGGQTFTQTDLTTSGSVVGMVDQASATTSYAASAGWGSSNFLKLYKSTNGGNLWDTLNINTSIPAEGLLLFDFIDSINGTIAVEGVSGGVHLYNTTDGGLSWVFNDSIIGYPYDLELTANTGYLTGNTNSFYKWNNTSVGIDSPIEKDVNQMVLYPNPVASGSVLNWDSEVDYNQALIMDLSGKEVFKTSIPSKKLTLPNLNSGYYFIKLSNLEFQETIPLIVK